MPRHLLPHSGVPGGQRPELGTQIVGCGVGELLEKRERLTSRFPRGLRIAGFAQGFAQTAEALRLTLAVADFAADSHGSTVGGDRLVQASRRTVGVGEVVQ